MNTDSISTSPEQKEGYICPSCRLLFSIIPNVGGNGVVCPGCSKLLTVPSPEDGVASQETSQVRYKQAGLASVDKLEDAYRRERQWEQQRHQQMEEIETQDKELRWMVPLALIAIVLLGGLGYVLVNSSQNKPIVASSQDVDTQDSIDEARGFGHSNPEDRKKLENFLEKFLAAESVDDLIPYVVNVESLREKMIAYYGGEKIKQSKLIEAKQTGDLGLHPGYIITTFEDQDFKMQRALIKYDDGAFKLDWESYVGYSEISWEEMKRLKPVQPFTMRVVLSVKDFYLYDFSDEKLWQSVSLTNPNVDVTMYGYVKRGSAVEQLVSNFGMTTANYYLTVKARYPENATRDDQFEIVEVISNSWLVEEK